MTEKSERIISAQQVKEFREAFMKDLKEDEYYANDIEKVKTNDDYCQRFINHEEEIDAGVKMAHSALKWRKDFGVENITEKTIPKEVWDMASLYMHGKDKGGHLVLIFHVKKHKKIAEQADLIKKFVIYWFEKMEKETNGREISVIFDCIGSGLSNMDMDLMRFIVDSFKFRYPSFLNNILVIEIPWVLNAAWKVIKLWLPTKSIQKIKFVNRKGVLEFMDASELLECMGGEDKFEFKYTPTE